MSGCCFRVENLHVRLDSVGSDLCERSPVHVGTSNEHMFSVNDPELGVEDSFGQAAEVHRPDMSSCRRKGKT